MTGMSTFQLGCEPFVTKCSLLSKNLTILLKNRLTLGEPMASLSTSHLWLSVDAFYEILFKTGDINSLVLFISRLNQYFFLNEIQDNVCDLCTILFFCEGCTTCTEKRAKNQQAISDVFPANSMNS